MMRRAGARVRYAAFTLIELLVVMAITVILLGLIFGPLVQGFNLTNRARVQVETQDVARRVAEIGQRDLAQAVFVFDNSQQSLNFWIRQPDANGEPNGPALPQPVPFCFMDLVAPARALDQNPSPDPLLIDPTTGVVGNRGDVALPLAPGRVLIRYFLGLRNNATTEDGTYGTSGMPTKPYLNYYDRPTRTAVSNHNPMILYRAVVAPFTSTGAVDTRFFAVDNAGSPILFDPNFFYDNSDAAAPSDPNITSAAFPGWRDNNGDGRVNRSENWKALARALVPTDRADEVTVQHDENRNPIYFTDPATNRPYMRINPLVKFQPTYVGNDSGAPTSTRDLESGLVLTPPSSHRETYGHWTAPFNAYVYYSGLAGPVVNYYYWDGTVAGIRDYTYDTSNNTSSFTDARFWPSRFSLRAGKVDPNNPPLDKMNPPSIMFSVDPRRGMVNFAFPDWIWLYNAANGEPQPSTWTAANIATINSQLEAYYGLNGPSDPNGKRYIDLQSLPDSRTSPIGMIPNCIVVPGSDIVVGPDMRPGAHYGMSIPYTRVTDPNAKLGPNEYRIRYVNDASYYSATYATLDDMEKASLRKGVIVFDSESDPDGSRYHRIPTQKNDGSAADPIVVTYQIQNNWNEQTGAILQTVKADYLTRQLMSFTLGVKLYEFNSGQPQSVSLTQKITVRNLQR